MKGTWAYALTLAVLLTGCGTRPESPDAAPAETAAQTAVPEADTQNPTQETAAPEFVSPAETAAPETDFVPAEMNHDTIITCYKTAIEEKVEAAKEFAAANGDEYQNFSIDYSLYDMDHDGTPELFIKYGTCEADFRYAICTCRDGSLRTIGDELPGGHMCFGYDYKANQYVAIQGHMGYGDMTWYDLDENGELRELINTGGFEYGMDGQPEYDDYMKKYNVAYLPVSNSFSLDGGIKTYLSYTPETYTGATEFDGLNFSLLENYQF